MLIDGGSRVVWRMRAAEKRVSKMYRLCSFLAMLPFCSFCPSRTRRDPPAGPRAPDMSSAAMGSRRR